MATPAEAKKDKTKAKIGKSETKGRGDHIDHLVSKRLKMRRMIMGYSQQELAEALGVSIQQIQKYEKAMNRISSGRLYTLAQFLQVPVTYFFNQIEDSNLAIGNAFAEDAEEYNGSKPKTIKASSKGADGTDVSEREIISLVKAFSEVKNPIVRKKFVELLRIIYTSN